MFVLTVKEKRALILLLVCFVSGVILYWLQEGELATGREYSVVLKKEKASSKSQSVLKFNLNEATQFELEKIPGIGPSMAKRIVAYRKENRRFFKKDELKEVKGIGEKRYQQIKKYVDIR